MNVDYTTMKSETMSVLSNPTIISYSLIFCSTLILGYYTLHDSQAFKPSEDSGESKSFFSSSDTPAKEETAPEPATSSTNFFGGPEKKDEPASTNFFGGPEKEEDKTAPSTNILGSPGKEEENPPPSTNTVGGPEKEEEKPAEEAKPTGTGGKKSRNRNKKNAKKGKKSKKNHKS